MGLHRRKFMAAIAASGLTTASSTIGSAATSAFESDLRAVNPQLRPAAIAMMQQFGSMPNISQATLPAMRRAMFRFSVPPLPLPAVRKRLITGLRDQPDVTIYIINARPDGERPVIIHTHGGGFVLGNAAGGIGSLQPIATALDCVIVTVDFRLAPETTFAGSIEDNYAALNWVYDHAAELGVDRRRIAVMGESGGGGHAALLAITARDRGEIPIVFQSLIYPMLDDRTGSVITPAAPIGRLGWTAANNLYCWQAFLGQAPGSVQVPAAAVPARQVDLKGLPPAFVGVGSIDLFVDEDVDYARRLIDSGIPAELMVVPGAFHGFDMAAANTLLAKQFTEAKLNALRQALSTPS